mgnify:CR=1 FL=1|tara:strand:- start:2160 stop:3269 length:1110 start_codon:yes stop_codon:yes gene_type:complete
MSNNKHQIYFDFGLSKLRASAFNKVNLNEVFYTQSKFIFDQIEVDSEIQKIITLLENNTNEYVDDINLMVDDNKMLSIGISVSKKIDDIELKQEDIRFLVQEAKQQILKHYNSQNIVHIIINNYKINHSDYDYLPLDKKCNFISLDILFICLPEKTIQYFKKLFYRFDISINQIICSSYAKALNYKENFSLNDNISFIDIGFSKTSITTYLNNKIISLDVLPIGGNHITKDISQILKVNLEEAENLKFNFDKKETFLNDKNFQLDMLKKIIFARIEEILELCVCSIKLNLNIIDQYKMVLMGDGAKILDNQYKNEISFTNNIDFLEETIEDICLSGYKLGMGSNKHEVTVVPKKQVKQGFFEKLFHFFK